MDYKVIIGIITVLLSFVGYGVYIRDIFKRKTVPHAFTFFVWAIASSITWALQVYGGAGAGSWVTLSASLLCIFIFFLSLRYGEKNITGLDIVFFILSLIALFLWLVADQPVLSVILIVATDVLGFAPTIRKSWNKPQEETVFTWGITAFRHGLSILALRQFNILTLFYPVVWVFMNAFFAIFLIIRRRQVKNNNI